MIERTTDCGLDEWQSGYVQREMSLVHSLTEAIVVGDDETEIMKMIAQLPKETKSL